MLDFRPHASEETTNSPFLQSVHTGAMSWRAKRSNLSVAASPTNPQAWKRASGLCLAGSRISLKILSAASRIRDAASENYSGGSRAREAATEIYSGDPQAREKETEIHLLASRAREVVCEILSEGSPTGEEEKKSCF
jgi:hypothetical protein